MILLTGLLAAGLAVAHIVAATMPRIADRHRRGWLSFAAGVSVAYVFVHILPELLEHSRTLGESMAERPGGRHVFVIALLGMCIYYGMERLAITFRAGRNKDDEADQRIFWLHVAAFSVYNAMVGYLLVRRGFESPASTTLFAVAMGLHFLVNDYALEQHHLEDYRRRGRWLLAAAVLAGWALGAAIELPEPALAALFAFFAGGIIVNILKEELPEQRNSRFGPFLIGAAMFAALLLAVE